MGISFTFEMLWIGILALLYGLVGFVIGFGAAFVPLRLVQAFAHPQMLADSVVSIVSLASACLTACVAGAGYLKARQPLR